MDERDLTELLREHATRHSVPGAAIGVMLDGVATVATWGVAEVSTGEPVGPDTRFSAGSLTKSMVATATERLAADGLLSFDDPVAEHVPELREAGWAHRATLRDLMANRSGLPLRSDLEFGFGRRPHADDGALSRLASDVAGAPPSSSAWSYSNAGWCLVGRAIETATGTTWEDAMREHLFDGAGMRGAAFATSPLPGRAAGHELGPDGPVPEGPLTARAYGPAGTTLVATATDVLRFAELHLQDPSLKALRETHADVAIDAWLDAWCLGWARFDWPGGPVWGWDGLIRGERSVLRLLPEHRTAVVLMANCGTGRAMYRSLFAELMPSFAVRVPPLRLDATPGAAGDLSRFTGRYAWPDRHVDVAVDGDGLLISDDGDELRARPIDERTFLVDPADPDNPTVTFGAFDSDGRPGALYLMLWGMPRLERDSL